MKNTGLVLEPIAPEDFVQGTDRSLEVKFGAQVLQPDGNWKDYLPASEKQAPGYETSGCVTFNTLTAIETLANRLFADKNNLSDRMVAKLSGTNPNSGNTPKKVADYIYRKWSVLEKEWPTSAATSAADFYAEIPEELKTLAIARGAEYEFGYQYVPTSKSAIREALKNSPVCISVPAWYEQDGLYYRPQGAQDNHWTLCYGMDGDQLLIEDTYPPHKKVMRADFEPTVAMRYHLDRQVVSENLFNKFIRLIKELLGI